MQERDNYTKPKHIILKLICANIKKRIFNWKHTQTHTTHYIPRAMIKIMTDRGQKTMEKHL